MRHHPLYGDIPLVAASATGTDGKVHRYWTYDLDFTPPLPPGAVRGNVRSQSFCFACHVPRYFFVDEDRTCVQCGEPFVFRAAEQKHWYERLKFHFSSVPVRCVECRRTRRSERALREGIALARAELRRAPKDPVARLAVARAIVLHHERTGRGSLDEAVAEARKAFAAWPESIEPRYWEAVAQARARRPAKARALLAAIVAEPGRLPPGIRRKATILLQSLDAAANRDDTERR
ncbi:MAG: zinc-ribbon domain-containing protein [Vicinamibacteria bacterium]